MFSVRPCVSESWWRRNKWCAFWHRTENKCRKSVCSANKCRGEFSSTQHTGLFMVTSECRFLGCSLTDQTPGCSSRLSAAEPTGVSAPALIYSRALSSSARSDFPNLKCTFMSASLAAWSRLNRPCSPGIAPGAQTLSLFTRVCAQQLP